MVQYIGKRLLAAIPVLWGVATLVFLAIRLVPGDPAEVILAQSGGSSASLAQLRTQLGLDGPLYVQYVRFLSDALRGDLGRSIFTNRPVIQTISEQLPHTVQLALAAMVIAIVLGGVLGSIAALKSGSWIDTLCMILAVIGVSTPVFWSALLLILLFTTTLHWLPATGQGDLRHLIMPALVLGLASSGTIARLVRSSLLEVLNQEYIVVARSKGLSESRVVLRHALRNALIPTVTVIGLQFGFLLGGAVVTETVFSRQGMGRLIVDAILWKDFPLIQGIVLLSAALYTLVNLVVDVSYAFLDPRIRHE
ncbi:MAG: ABC transporter permease [Anaerolineae bacterium]|jgi:ABC-type dipeptide/oligopeptide/nickel transport system permease component|nr:ABC transporter permease [Anaerolineae bacterium]MDH7475048.1 ABC transporter permease [Anaerolineae bacterium]